MSAVREPLFLAGIGIDVNTSKGSVVNVTDNAEVSGSLYGIYGRNDINGQAIDAKLNIDHATVTGGSAAVFSGKARPSITRLVLIFLTPH
jgi:hypothetical protein